MKKFKLVSLATAVAIATTLLAAGPASAAELDEYSDVEGPTQTGLIFEPVEGTEISPMAVEFSPAGCAGQTDYAHWSFNEASVHGRTTCTVAVGSLGVTTMLQKQGWLYWETMETDHNSNTNSTTSRDAHPHWWCGNWGSQNYRGVSTHWSEEASGRYSATTVGTEQRFSC